MPDLDPDIARAIKYIMRSMPFNDYLGIRVTDLSLGFVRMVLPYRHELIGDPFTPALHGGVMSTLLDTCGGAAVSSQFTDSADRTHTIDLRIDYLRPGRKEDLVGEGRVIRRGRQVAVVDMVAFHPGNEDSPVATARGAYALRPHRTGAEKQGTRKS